MNCDRCKELIDENLGYATIESSITAKFSHREGGTLITKNTMSPEIKREKICVPCMRKIGDKQ